MEVQKLQNGDDIINKELKKEIGLSEAITVVIGVVIGSGIFFKASSVFKSAGSPALGILAWIVGGLITMASALTVAEVAAAIPKTGGIFVYIKELYGEKWAFLFGWMQAIIYVPGVTAALAIIFVTQLTYFIEDMTILQQKLLAIVVLLFIASINMISTKLGSKMQLVITIAKLIPIFVIVVFGLINGDAHSLTVHNTNATVSTTGIAGFGSAILATLWAYDGWAGIGNMAGELKNPQKDLPKSIIIGMLVIITVYILVNVAIINIMPVKSVIESSKAASDAATILFGKKGAALITIGIIISIFGTLNGYLMTGVRIPFAMSQDNIFPFATIFKRINKKFETPANIIVLESILSILYILSGSFDTLTNLVVFVMWIFFIMSVAGVFILRKKHSNLERPYKVPFYPITPLIGILGGFYILISTFITDTFNAVYGIIITLIGLPIYFYLKKKEL
ncbi:serine/threonine exchange transporter, LAT family [Clostridium sp. USBA 49]|uniref:APC family permease n=1 Tax=Clostridium sp. USBA 49 TaxID=1881060 RepID=UPI000999BC88|nr:amino acid permease [Clostridium sp. USBA 49]SKA73326.1 serine/threonine exchange transporter, LAT family [Clostridium sp. USBA 49]